MFSHGPYCAHNLLGGPASKVYSLARDEAYLHNAIIENMTRHHIPQQLWVTMQAWPRMDLFIQSVSKYIIASTHVVNLYT